MTQLDLIGGGSPFSIPAESPHIPADCNETEALWVSTDLKTWQPSDPSFIGPDCALNDRWYRRLDPAYFAWLRHRMLLVKAAADNGRVDGEAFHEARQRFNVIQDRAIAMFGEPALLEGVRTLDADLYRPPMPDQFEKMKLAEPVLASSRAKRERIARARGLVDEVRDQALALGWSMDRLYFWDEARPWDAKSGLICYVGAQHRLGRVTGQWIELIGPAPAEPRTRFYNPEVEQPWVKRIGTQPLSGVKTPGNHRADATRKSLNIAPMEAACRALNAAHLCAFNASEEP